MPLPEDVSPRELDPEVRSELASLSKDTADTVARHLVMTGRLLDDDPQRSLSHARAAAALAGRVGAVREAAGIAAYLAGEWSEAVAELRAARRITGRVDHLPIVADCERAMGRPERAVAAYDDPAVHALDQAVRVELAIVVAGARRDMGQPEAAVLLLQGPAKATTAKRPWAARLWYAYAANLLDAGREQEAVEWFTRAAEVDQAGDTDAGDRLLELQGLVFGDGPDDDGQEPSGSSGIDGPALQDLVAGLAPLAGTNLEGTPDPDSAPAAGPTRRSDVPHAETPAPSVAADIRIGDGADRSTGQPTSDEPPRPVPAVAFSNADDRQGGEEQPSSRLASGDRAAAGRADRSQDGPDAGDGGSASPD